jgi:hypothetical protein
MRLRALLVVALVLGIASAIAAASSTADDVTSSTPTTTAGTTTTEPAGPVPDMRLGAFRTKRTAARVTLHEKKEQLCRSHERAHFIRTAREIRVDRRRENLARWRHRRDHARTLASKCSPVDLGRKIAAREYGWTSANGQWQHVFALFNRESGWNPCRRYPSTTECGYGPFYSPAGYACGIPQFVPCTKLIGYGRELGSVPASVQIRKGFDYVRARYGTPAAADYFQLTHNYY